MRIVALDEELSQSQNEVTRAQLLILRWFRPAVLISQGAMLSESRCQETAEEEAGHKFET